MVLKADHNLKPSRIATHVPWWLVPQGLEAINRPISWTQPSSQSRCNFLAFSTLLSHTMLVRSTTLLRANLIGNLVNNGRLEIRVIGFFMTTMRVTR